MSSPFLDPGPLIDGDLELIAPHIMWVDELLEACHHKLTKRQSPKEAETTRESVERFLRLAPHGREPGDPARAWVPSYHFWMKVTAPDVPVRIGGGIAFRIGSNREIDTFVGNVGYHVYPPARGHHYAERAVRLLLPLARRHGMPRLWITCNPDNLASRRTCERLGARLIETVPIPSSHPFYSRGERAKCRFLIEL
jgi:tagatose 1,6-diphosphate aldolase